MVGDIAFQPANRHRFPADRANTVLFTLVFLRTDAAADCREAVGLGNDAVSFVDLALLQRFDEVRDHDRNRAARRTRMIDAVQTTICLIDHLFLSIA